MIIFIDCESNNSIVKSIHDITWLLLPWQYDTVSMQCAVVVMTTITSWIPSTNKTIVSWTPLCVVFEIFSCLCYIVCSYVPKWICVLAQKLPSPFLVVDYVALVHCLNWHQQWCYYCLWFVRAYVYFILKGFNHF